MEEGIEPALLPGGSHFLHEIAGPRGDAVESFRWQVGLGQALIDDLSLVGAVGLAQGRAKRCGGWKGFGENQGWVRRLARHGALVNGSP